MSDPNTDGPENDVPSSKASAKMAGDRPTGGNRNNRSKARTAARATADQAPTRAPRRVPRDCPMKRNSRKLIG